MSEELRLQRSQIHDFVGDDPDAVRVIEKLLKGYNTLINTSLVYDPLKTYSAGQYVSEDSVIYESQVSSNTGNLPSTSPTEWRILMETGSNSNGSYIVFSSGIQVCWADGLTFSGLSAANAFDDWTMPNAFANTDYHYTAQVTNPSFDSYYLAVQPWPASWKSTTVCRLRAEGDLSSKPIALFAIGEAG